MAGDLVKISKGDKFTMGKILEKFIDDVSEAIEAGDIALTLDIISDNDYTKKQRGALHVWCKLMAEALNDAGFEMQVTILSRSKEETIIEIPWDGPTFKKIWYKQTLVKMTGLKSTEDQKTVTPGEVYNVLARFFSEAYGVHVPWPSKRG